MKFSKVFLASLLAVVVGGIATTLFFLFAGVGMIASLGATPELPTPANSVLYIDLNENIVDSPAASPLGTLNPETMTFEVRTLRSCAGHSFASRSRESGLSPTTTSTPKRSTTSPR